jgi:hypothetical protein
MREPGAGLKEGATKLPFAAQQRLPSPAQALVVEAKHQLKGLFVDAAQERGEFGVGDGLPGLVFEGGPAPFASDELPPRSTLVVDLEGDAELRPAKGMR